MSSLGIGNPAREERKQTQTGSVQQQFCKTDRSRFLDFSSGCQNKKPDTSLRPLTFLFVFPENHMLFPSEPAHFRPNPPRPCPFWLRLCLGPAVNQTCSTLPFPRAVTQLSPSLVCEKPQIPNPYVFTPQSSLIHKDPSLQLYGLSTNSLSLVET